MIDKKYCVYVLWGDNDQILYIGSSRKVYSRVIDHLREKEGIKSVSVIESTKKNYINLEQAMILEHLPVMNASVNLNQFRRNIEEIPDLKVLQKLTLEEFEKIYCPEMQEGFYLLYKGFTIFRDNQYCGIKPRKCSKYCFNGLKFKYHCYMRNRDFLKQKVDELITKQSSKSP